MHDSSKGQAVGAVWTEWMAVPAGASSMSALARNRGAPAWMAAVQCCVTSAPESAVAAAYSGRRSANHRVGAAASGSSMSNEVAKKAPAVVATLRLRVQRGEHRRQEAVSLRRRTDRETNACRRWQSFRLRRPSRCRHWLASPRFLRVRRRGPSPSGLEKKMGFPLKSHLAAEVAAPQAHRRSATVEAARARGHRWAVAARPCWGLAEEVVVARDLGLASVVAVAAGEPRDSVPAAEEAGPPCSAWAVAVGEPHDSVPAVAEEAELPCWAPVGAEQQPHVRMRGRAAVAVAPRDWGAVVPGGRERPELRLAVGGPPMAEGEVAALCSADAASPEKIRMTCLAEPRATALQLPSRPTTAGSATRATSSVGLEAHRMPQPGCQAVEAERSTAAVVAEEEHRQPRPQPGFLQKQDWTSSSAHQIHRDRTRLYQS